RCADSDRGANNTSNHAKPVDGKHLLQARGVYVKVSKYPSPIYYFETCNIYQYSPWLIEDSYAYQSLTAGLKSHDWHTVSLIIFEEHGPPLDRRSLSVRGQPPSLGSKIRWPQATALLLPDVGQIADAT